MKYNILKWFKKSKRVLLVNPLSPLHLHKSPPLSIAYLAAQIKRMNYIPGVIDASAVRNQFDIQTVVQHAIEFKPDVIGVTIMTPFALNAYKTIRALKTLNVPVVAGGPHATLLPVEVLENGADFAVRYEGEIAFAGLLNALFNGKSFDQTPCIAYRNAAGQIQVNPARRLTLDLDELPMPDFSVFEPKWYQENTQGDPFAGNMITGRGCPGRCAFCSRAVFGRNVRFHSPERIVREMVRFRREYGISEYFVHDDAFSCDRDRTIRICHAIKCEPELKNISWSCVTRVNMVDREVLNHMKEAGAVTVTFGIESGSDRTLSRIKKDINRKMIVDAVNAASEAGLNIAVNFILGYPDEDAADVMETIDLVRRIETRVNVFNAGFLIPFPGTEYYRRYKHLDSVGKFWLREDPEGQSPEISETNQRSSVGGPRNIDDYWYKLPLELKAANLRLKDLFDSLHEVRTSAGMACQFQHDIDRTGIYLSWGWYPPEHVDQETYRWTDGCGLIVLSGYRGILEITAKAQPEVAPDVDILQDNQRLMKTKLDTEWTRISVEAGDNSGATRKIIQLKTQSWRPVDIGLNADPRKLGIQVKQIRFTPLDQPEIKR